MKRSYNYIYPLLIIVIMLLYFSPYFQKGFPVGHDNIAQVARTAARISAIYDGQFPVRWAANLNYGYGHPGFIFFYSLPGYLGVLFHFFGINLELSYKILMGVTFVLTPLSFYFWSKEIFEKKIAFVSSLMYGLAPYSFLNTFVRIHLGESLALVFIPLIFLCIERNTKKIHLRYILSGAAAYTLLIHSHTILSFIFSFVFVLYILIKSRDNKKSLIANFVLLGIGLSFSAYFIIPALVESKYINTHMFLSSWYKNQFLHPARIIYAPWGFGSNVNEPGGLTPQIGPLHFIFALFSVSLLGKKGRNIKSILMWILVFIFGVFMSTSYSDFFWRSNGTLQQFQFPWRFISIVCLSSSLLTGYFLSFYTNKYLTIGTLILLLLLSIPMATIQRMEPYKTDSFYFHYPGTAAYHNEATTIWVAGDADTYASSKIEIISGNGEISGLSLKSTRHSFNIKALDPVRILDNTVYFPGWKALVDGQKVPIEFQDSNHRGLITFPIPKGNHRVSVVFSESPIRLLSDYVSIAGFCLVLILLIFRSKIDGILQDNE